MQILGRTVNVKLHCRNAAQGKREGRIAGSHHTGVRNDDDVAVEFGAMLCEKVPEIIAPNFFFAFNKKNEVRRGGNATSGEHIGSAKDMSHYLAFVVRRTA